MNRRQLSTAAVAAATVGLAACGGTSTAATSGPKTLEVWLMAGSAPPSLVTDWNQEFEQAHPGVKVHVDLQQWTDIVTKTDTALSTSAPPDVLEMGNTYVAGFAATGGLANLTGATFQNRSTWLESLTEAGTYNGKLYGVPYYAGDRIVIYRKSMFAKAGITTPPTTTAQLVTDAQALNAAESGVSHFSPIYVAGKYWYGIFSWIFDAGGGIAKQVGGQWQGEFSSPADQQALTWVHSLFTQGLDKAPGDADETNDDKVFEAGQAAMIIEPGWDYGVVQSDFTKAKNTAAADDLGVFVIPGQSGPAPVFLGGSNLGVAAKSPNQQLATDYLKLVSNNDYEAQMATVGGVIPNSTTLLGLDANDPVLSVANAAAAKSWFVPNTPKEGELESQNVYTSMLAEIMTGQESVAQATATADQQVASILNG